MENPKRNEFTPILKFHKRVRSKVRIGRGALVFCRFQMAMAAIMMTMAMLVRR